LDIVASAEEKKRCYRKKKDGRKELLPNITSAK
jgi:hypothetical protein